MLSAASFFSPRRQQRGLSAAGPDSLTCRSPAMEKTPGQFKMAPAQQPSATGHVDAQSPGMARDAPCRGALRPPRSERMRVFTLVPMADWRSVPTAGKAAEAVGFDALMSVELNHDPFAPLALAATATERIELTTSVAVAFPRSPTVIAMQAWDLHANSGGRFVLGLGPQVKGHNERRFGVP